MYDRTCRYLALALLLKASSAFAANPTTMAFAPGGSIRMDLHSGAVEVVGTTDDQISVSWRSRPPDDESSVTVDLRQASPDRAVVSIDGPANHTTYRIQVPSRSNIDVRMHAGELDVQGVTGDIKADLLAGSLNLGVAEPRDYRSVRAAAVFGEVSARPWRFDSGGVARTFRAEGSGPFEIDAHVLAGELTIRQK